MNARISKEIRVLLPSFGLLLAAAVVPILSGPHKHELPEIWMGILFSMGCILMGAEVFGNEFQQRTVGQLLAQPISRAVIWKEKMSVLGGALAVGASVFWAAVLAFDRQLVGDANFPWALCVLFPIAVLCTVPCWTLLFQSTLLGVLVALVAPLGILAVNSLLHDHWMRQGTSVVRYWFAANDYIHQLWSRAPAAEENSVITLMVLYSGVGCWGGYRQFKKLQVGAGHLLLATRELRLPRRLDSLLSWDVFSTGILGQFGVLLKKEMRIQWVSFLGAIAFCAVTFALSIVWNWMGAGNSTREVISMCLVASFLFYVPLLPLVAGAVGVCEEKAWGVAGWHLALPPSALKQWIAKILAMFGTSFALGILLPACWAIGGSMLFGTQQESTSLPRLHSLRSLLGFLEHGDANREQLASVSLVIRYAIDLILCQGVVTSVAIYSGVLSRTTARGLVLGLMVLGAMGALVGTGISTALNHKENILNYLSESWPTIEVSVDFHMVLETLLALWLCAVHLFAYRWFRTHWTSRALAVQVPLLAFLMFLCAFLSAIFW